MAKAQIPQNDSETQGEIELKPCPFCGFYNNYLTITTSNSRVFCVLCSSCCAEGPFSESRESAAKNWNTRFEKRNPQQELFEKLQAQYPGLGIPTEGYLNWVAAQENPALSQDEPSND